MSQEQVKESTEDNNVVTKRLIEMVGKIEGDQACDSCIEFDKSIQGVKKDDLGYELEYKHVDVDTEEGTKIVDEKQLDAIPHIKDCKIFKDGHRECRDVKGMNKEDWSDLLK